MEAETQRHASEKEHQKCAAVFEEAKLKVIISISSMLTLDLVEFSCSSRPLRKI